MDNGERDKLIYETHISVCKLEKLLLGNGQPGWITQTNEKINKIENGLINITVAHKECRSQRTKEQFINNKWKIALVICILTAILNLGKEVAKGLIFEKELKEHKISEAQNGNSGNTTTHSYH